MNVSEAMMAPMVIFLTIVAPLWLILHYRSKKNSARALATEDSETIEHLARLAEKMDTRLAALEKILEADDPKWKEKAQ